MQLKEERHPWRQEEDNLIVELVRLHGTKKWTLIAEVLGDKVHNSRRNGKQCRERWHNHLDPMVRKSPWNESEEFVFIEAHKLHGNKWAEIAKMIPGRTDNSIKNHFYSTLRKLISRVQKDEIPPEMKYDLQVRKHTTYLAKYLKSLIIANQNKLPGDQLNDNIHHRGGRNAASTTNSRLNQFLIDSNIEMGSNDLYVIKKLREADITQQKIDQYLRKVYLSIKEVVKRDSEAQGGLQKPVYINPSASEQQDEHHIDFGSNDCQRIMIVGSNRLDKIQEQKLSSDHDLQKNDVHIFQNELRIQQQNIPKEKSDFPSEYQDSHQNSNGSRPIFQISKEEIKTEYHATSICHQDREDSDMIDDFEKFINEGDKLVLDDLQMKSATLMKEYLSAKEFENSGIQSAKFIDDHQMNNTFQRQMRQTLPCENNDMMRNAENLGDAQRQVYQPQQYIIINERNDQVHQGSSQNIKSIPIQNQIQSSNFSRPYAQSGYSLAFVPDSQQSQSIGQSKSSDKAPVGVASLILDSTTQAVIQDNNQSTFQQFIQVPTQNYQSIQQPPQIICIPYDSVSSTPQPASQQVFFTTTTNALPSGTNIIYHQDTGFSPNIPSSSQPMSGSHQSRIIVTNQSPHSSFTPINHNLQGVQQAYYQDIGQAGIPQRSISLGILSHQHSPYLQNFSHQIQKLGDPSQSVGSQYIFVKNSNNAQQEKYDLAREKTCQKDGHSSSENTPVINQTLKEPQNSARQHQVFFGPQVMKGGFLYPSQLATIPSSSNNTNIAQIQANSHNFENGTQQQQQQTLQNDQNKLQDLIKKLQNLKQSQQTNIIPKLLTSSGVLQTQNNLLIQNFQTQNQKQVGEGSISEVNLNGQSLGVRSSVTQMNSITKASNLNQSTNSFQRGFSAPINNFSGHSPKDIPQNFMNGAKSFSSTPNNNHIGQPQPPQAIYYQIVKPQLRQHNQQQNSEQQLLQPRQVQTKILVSQASNQLSSQHHSNCQLKQELPTSSIAFGGLELQDISSPSANDCMKEDIMKVEKPLQYQHNMMMMSNLSQETSTQVQQLKSDVTGPKGPMSHQ